MKSKALPYLHTSVLPYVIALLLFLPACSTITAEEPPPVADSTLVEVLAGLHLARARAEIKGDAPAGLRDSILTHHHLTRRRFEAVMEYYTTHPQAYTALYERVLDHLQAERRGDEGTTRRGYEGMQ